MEDRSDTTKLCTYPEIAAAFAMTVASARNLARKRRWQKVPANSGDRKTVKVLVPLDELPTAPPVRNAAPIQHPDSTADALAILARHIEQLQAEVTSLRTVEAQVAGLKATLEAARDEASRLRVERDDYLAKLVSRRWWQFRKAI